MSKKNSIQFIKNHYLSNLKECINDLKTKGKRKKQIPNILTASRIVAPFIIVPVAMTGNLIGSAILAALFASTDFFDGLAARKLNAHSEFGRELDPIADKFFAAGLLIPIVSLNPINIYPLFFEVAIALVNVVSKVNGNEPKTNLLGKVKTWALSTSIILNYCSLFFSMSSVISSIATTITCMLQFGAFSSYLIKEINKNTNKAIEKKDYGNKDDEKEIKKDLVYTKKNVKNKELENLRIQKNILKNCNKNVESCNKCKKK